MNRLKTLYIKLTDDPEKIGFDYHLIILSCIFAILAFAVGLVINIILPFGTHIIVSTSAGLIFYSILYYLARFRRKYLLTKIIYILTLSIFLDILWLTNFGSRGPIMFIYIVVYTGFLFYLNGKQLVIYTIFFFINTLGMFLIEYYSPGILGEYPDEHTRVVDVYSGLIIYLMIASGLMLYIKRGFIRERDKAMHSEKLMSAFLANMSHEIRTPLNSIQGFIQLLDKRVTDEKLKNYIRTIDQNSQHLLQIISDLLDISSLEAGELRLTYTNVVVKELFEDIHFMLTRHYSQFIHTWAEISYQLVPEDLTFFSDYTRLKQILLNLLTNAMKYTDKGEIKYYCQLEGRNIRFSVTDTGEGIDRDFQKEVFNRFRKKEGRKKTYSGTGIGLSITKDLVELLGGSIWFHSEINKGTEFYFTIPFLTAMPKN